MPHFTFFDDPPEIAAQKTILRAEIAGTRLHLAMLGLYGLVAKRNFNPNEPRIPAGSPGGGRWSREGGGGGSRHLRKWPQSDVTAKMGLHEREAARRALVLERYGGNFLVAPNPSASPRKPWYEDASLSQVKKYDGLIRLVAKQQKVDADLIRTVMYLETTHGHYFGLGPLADALHVSKSVLPMNVNVSVWSKLGSRDYLDKPYNNITAGTKIIKGILGNLKSPSVNRVATLYNSPGQVRVSNYGARAAAIYRQKPWNK
jgi:hypothetical protein